MSTNPPAARSAAPLEDLGCKRRKRIKPPFKNGGNSYLYPTAEYM